MKKTIAYLTLLFMLMAAHAQAWWLPEPGGSTTGESTTAGDYLTLTGVDIDLDAEVITQTKCAIIENLAAADDDFEIAMFNHAVTITAVGLHCAGTCTTGADISLEDRAGNAMTHTVPTHSTGTDNTTFQSVTAANALVAGEAVRFDVDNAVDPETDTYTICVEYTIPDV